MRFVLYNIRYGTGGKRMMPWEGYLGNTEKNLDIIIDFFRQLDPDLIGLVEVDSGSYRTKGKNQAETIAQSLGHYHIYKSKYDNRSLAQNVPVINRQGNAFLAKDTIHNQVFHYFDKGMKRLVIELELENVVIFLVHLALGTKVRHYQLGNLYALVERVDKPYIVAGDFNALWGEGEIDMFLAATGLINADKNSTPSFPSWSPRRHLDFILHSPEIKVTDFQVPKVTYSDHPPLVCDFEVG